MNSHGEPLECPRTSAVLALYLDGDVVTGDGRTAQAEDTGYDFACPDRIADHLRDCSACRTALHRARRLDCMLAESAWRTATRALDEAAIDRLCSTALQQAAEAPAEAAYGSTGGGSTSSGSVGSGSVGSGSVGSGAPGHGEGNCGLGFAFDFDTDESAGANAPLAGDPAATPSQWLVAAIGLVICAACAWFALHGAGSPETARTGSDVATADDEAAPASVLRPALNGSTPDGSTSREQSANATAISQPLEIAPAAVLPGPAQVKPTLEATVASGGGTATISPVAAGEAPRQLRAAWREHERLLGRLLDTGAGLPARIAAAAELLASDRIGAAGTTRMLTAIVRTLADVRAATPAESELLVSALAAARGDATVHAYLMSNLRALDAGSAAIGTDDLATIVTATRMGSGEVGSSNVGSSNVGSSQLGSGELDAAVRRAVRRHPELADPVAAALREPVRNDGAGRLLLDIWSDLAARGADEERLCTTLFADQRPAVFAEVALELEATRAATRRAQCLLALGASPDPSCVAPLRRWAGASARTEAYAAAYALSGLPHAWLDELVAAAKERGAFLLRAALARANHPAAAAFVEPLHLNRRERALLASATPDRFPEVAEWFRDGSSPRPPRSDD